VRLRVLPGELVVARLAPDAPVPPAPAVPVAPPGAPAPRPLWSVTRTAAELSIVCSPGDVPPGAVVEPGWRALAVAGPLDFALTGVLAALAVPLAEAGVSIFAASTYDTDHVLVRDLDGAVRALRAAGHEVDDAP
jgi:uncharacterized protein